MADKPKEKIQSDPIPPRVVADFGGRRKVFERRLKPCEIDHRERRSRYDRRSGFDRRGALSQNDVNGTEKRTDFAMYPVQ